MATSADGPTIDAARVIEDLRELDRVTGGPEGARRVAWGDEWTAARELTAGLLGEMGLEPERDEAGNVWAYMRGESERAVAIGSHLDSVPSGGWLDGALGVMAAIGVARSWAQAGRTPKLTIAVVDWADEEGARFGRSLFGSSAVAGTLDPAELSGLRDRDGRGPDEVLADAGVTLAAAPRASSRLERLAACLELHIEQGPVLEAEGAPAAAVSGCAGVERKRFSFAGRASHAGTTPMDVRRDAGLAAAETALAVERIAAEHGGVGTVGEVRLEPGVVTAVPGGAEIAVDLRHPRAEPLAAMLGAARAAAREAAARRKCDVSEEATWRIDPIPFDRALVQLAARACAAAGGREVPLVSGALHDAAEIARHVPTAMIFCPSVAGISHSSAEDTQEADLSTAIAAFGHLANEVVSGHSGDGFARLGHG